MKNTKSELYKSFELGENPILKYCKEKEQSIADICRRFDMKRSTLIYYLRRLERAKVITIKRIETKETGRPSMVKTDVKKIKELRKQRNKAVHEQYKRYMYEILQIVQDQRKTLSEKEIHTILKDKYSNLSKPPFYTGIGKKYWDKLNKKDKLAYINDTGVGEFIFYTKLGNFHPHFQFKTGITKEGKEYLKKHMKKYKKDSVTIKKDSSPPSTTKEYRSYFLPQEG